MVQDLSRPELDRAEVQAALRSWLLEVARRRPVGLAIDDLEHADEPSVALLATLGLDAPSVPLAYVATVGMTTSDGTGASPRATVRSRAGLMDVPPLLPEQTATLLGSVFGDVPNLQSTSQAIHRLAGGRPRACMRLAQHLVDRDSSDICGRHRALPPPSRTGSQPWAVNRRRVHSRWPTSRRGTGKQALGTC